MFIKKLLRAAGVAVVIFIAVTAVLNIIVVGTAKPHILTPYEAAAWAEERDGADCILVLGASVSENGPSRMLADRLDESLRQYTLGAGDLLLLSGDNGTIEYNEVQAMKDYALANGKASGLTEKNIYLDYAGFSTYDSVYRAKNLFLADKVVVVTQRYHLYRALYIAKRLGLDAVGVAAPDSVHGQFPRDLREIPARVKDFFLTATNHVPKIMGEAVPLEYPSSQAVQASRPPDSASKPAS